MVTPVTVLSNASGACRAMYPADGKGCPVQSLFLLPRTALRTPRFGDCYLSLPKKPASDLEVVWSLAAQAL